MNRYRYNEFRTVQKVTYIFNTYNKNVIVEHNKINQGVKING